jgi:hypothetical protein
VPVSRFFTGAIFRQYGNQAVAAGDAAELTLRAVDNHHVSVS